MPVGPPRGIGRRAAATPAPWRWPYGTGRRRESSFRTLALAPAGGLDARNPGVRGRAPQTLPPTNETAVEPEMATRGPAGRTSDVDLEESAPGIAAP